MSDPENDKKKPEDQTEVVEDAVIIEEGDETADDADIPDEAVEIADPAEDETEEDDAPIAAEEESPEEEPVETEPVVEEPGPAPAEPTVVRKGGFVPMVLGGVIAAGLGFGASQVLFPNGLNGSEQAAAVADLTAKLQQQTVQISGLSKELDAVKAASADSSATDELTGLVDDANGAVAQLADQVAALDARLSDMEKRPADGGISAAAVAAYEREVEALRQAMEKQKTEIEALITEAEAEKASAEMTAKQAMIRTAVSRIQVALDTGKGFANPVADLLAAGVSVPAILTETAESGVPTMGQLSADYPAAARKALASARKDEGTGGKVWGFLRNQLGVRSLEPKEGSDADAILSRAEAALNDGRLADAMAELQGLPELARVELTDWMTQATRRAEAVAAAETLSATLASN
ncbi:MAG: COG4223 family protein [Thalassovita sp.]